MIIQKTHPKSFIVRAHSTSTAFRALCEIYPLKSTDQKYGEKDIVILQMVKATDNWLYIEMVLKSDYEDQRNPDELESKIESLEKEIQEYTLQLKIKILRLKNKDFEIESLNQDIKNLLDQMNTESKVE